MQLSIMTHCAHFDASSYAKFLTLKNVTYIFYRFDRHSRQCSCSNAPSIPVPYYSRQTIIFCFPHPRSQETSTYILKIKIITAYGHICSLNECFNFLLMSACQDMCVTLVGKPPENTFERFMNIFSLIFLNSIKR